LAGRRGRWIPELDPTDAQAYCVTSVSLIRKNASSRVPTLEALI